VIDAIQMLFTTWMRPVPGPTNVADSYGRKRVESYCSWGMAEKGGCACKLLVSVLGFSGRGREA